MRVHMNDLNQQPIALKFCSKVLHHVNCGLFANIHNEVNHEYIIAWNHTVRMNKTLKYVKCICFKSKRKMSEHFSARFLKYFHMYKNVNFFNTQICCKMI